MQTWLPDASWLRKIRTYWDAAVLKKVTTEAGCLISKQIYSYALLLKVGSRQNLKNWMYVRRQFYLQKKNILATMFECTMHKCINSMKIWIENFGWRKAVKQTVVPSGTGKGSNDIVCVTYSILLIPVCCLVLYLYLLLLHFGQKKEYNGLSLR